jgi:hypothetical protein
MRPASGSSIRNAFVSVLIVSAVVTGTACAPTPSGAAKSIVQSAKSAGDKWTQKQWNAKRATDQKLSGPQELVVPLRLHDKLILPRARSSSRERVS